MPTSTFFNLPDEKRERIYNVAIDEFATHTYHKSSINRIVEEAEIAKGSFYQYFNNKKDLFKYVVDIIAKKKLEYLNHIMNDLENLSFFEILRELYLGGIKFGQEYPKLLSIGNHIMKMNDEQFKEEILGESASKSTQFFEQILSTGVKKGEIDTEIDIELTAFMLTHLNIAVSEYFYNNIEFDDEMEIMPLVDNMLYMIENGIKQES